LSYSKGKLGLLIEKGYPVTNEENQAQIFFSSIRNDYQLKEFKQRDVGTNFA
jgi:hypothetical protein